MYLNLHLDVLVAALTGGLLGFVAGWIRGRNGRNGR